MAATLFRYTRCAARFMSGTRKTIDFVPWMFPRRATRPASDFRPGAEDCLTVWSGSDTKSMDFVPWNEMVPGMVLCTGHVAVLRGPAAVPEILCSATIWSRAGAAAGTCLAAAALCLTARASKALFVQPGEKPATTATDGNR